MQATEYRSSFTIILTRGPRVPSSSVLGGTSTPLPFCPVFRDAPSETETDVAARPGTLQSTPATFQSLGVGSFLYLVLLPQISLICELSKWNLLSEHCNHLIQKRLIHLRPTAERPDCPQKEDTFG